MGAMEERRLVMEEESDEDEEDWDDDDWED